MTKKDQKEYQQFVKLQYQVLNYNARVETIREQVDALNKEHDRLAKQLDKLIAKYEKEENSDDTDE